MTRRYQHVTDTIRNTVADQVDGLLWDEAKPEGDGGEGALAKGN